MARKTKSKTQKAEEDANLDEALNDSFPASGPPSMTQPRTGADVTPRRPRRHPKGEVIQRGQGDASRVLRNARLRGLINPFGL
jgi:hypothetical protein